MPATKPHENISKVDAEIAGQHVKFRCQRDGVHVQVRYGRETKTVPFNRIYGLAFADRQTLKNPTAIELDVVRADLEIIIAAIEANRCDADMIAHAKLQLSKTQRILKA